MYPGVHEPPKAAKERQTQHVCPSGSSSQLLRYTARGLSKSVKDKLAFVRYRKNLTYKV